MKEFELHFTPDFLSLEGGGGGGGGGDRGDGDENEGNRGGGGGGMDRNSADVDSTKAGSGGTGYTSGGRGGGINFDATNAVTLLCVLSSKWYS